MRVQETLYCVNEKGMLVKIPLCSEELQQFDKVVVPPRLSSVDPAQLTYIGAVLEKNDLTKIREIISLSRYRKSYEVLMRGYKTDCQLGFLSRVPDEKMTEYPISTAPVSSISMSSARKA